MSYVPFLLLSLLNCEKTISSGDKENPPKFKPGTYCNDSIP